MGRKIKIIDLNTVLFELNGEYYKLKNAEIKKPDMLSAIIPGLNMRFMAPTFIRVDKTGKPVMNNFFNQKEQGKWLKTTKN